MSTTEVEQALQAHPQAKHYYETNPYFRKAIDDLFACLREAAATLSNEDYLKLLAYVRDEVIGDERARS